MMIKNIINRFKNQKWILISVSFIDTPRSIYHHETTRCESGRKRIFKNTFTGEIKEVWD